MTEPKQEELLTAYGALTWQLEVVQAKRAELQKALVTLENKKGEENAKENEKAKPNKTQA